MKRLFALLSLASGLFLVAYAAQTTSRYGVVAYLVGMLLFTVGVALLVARLK